MDDDVLLGVATPPEGWPPCICGSTVWPHECVWARLATTHGHLPDCEVCGRTDWPAGGMLAARAIHMRGHERAGEV